MTSFMSETSWRVYRGLVSFLNALAFIAGEPPALPIENLKSKIEKGLPPKPLPFYKRTSNCLEARCS